MPLDMAQTTALDPRDWRCATSSPKERIAVLFVHGQGEQAPLQDVMDLAFSTWETNQAASPGAQLATVWNIPVEDKKFSEQRYLVGLDGESVEVDYYQFYWAHLMEGNRFAHFWIWLVGLLGKAKSETPKVFRPLRAGALLASNLLFFGALLYFLTSGVRLMVAHADAAITWTRFFGCLFFAAGVILSWAWLSKSVERHTRFLATIVALLASLLFWAIAPRLLDVDLQICGKGACSLVLLAWFHVLFTGALVILAIATAPVLWYFNTTFLAPVMADSARFFSPAPENVNRRHEIRAAGVRMLKMLHSSKRGYKRIIVVGHSLGSVVAHAMMSQYWGTLCDDMRVKKLDVLSTLSKLEAAAMNLNRFDEMKERAGADDVRAFRVLQRKLFGSLARNVPATQRKWLISDFVTLGSPLTHSHFLLSESKEEFETSQGKHRRYAACPPLGDQSGSRLRIGQYEEGSNGSVGDVKLPHSALFALTRWTNLYFETEGLFKGDVVAGPLAPVFGSGILDVKLDARETRKEFAHNEYWRWPGESGALAHRSDRRAYDRPPQYLVALRRALNFFDSEDDDQALADFALDRTNPKSRAPSAALVATPTH